MFDRPLRQGSENCLYRQMKLILLKSECSLEIEMVEMEDINTDQK